MRRRRGVALAALCVAVGLLTLGCGSGGEPYRQALARAQRAERRDDFEAARRAYEEAARESRDAAEESEALYRAARLELEAQGHAAGAAALRAFAERHPSSPRAARAWLDVARALERAGDVEGARAAYRRVFTDYPRSSGAEAAARRWVATSERAAADEWTQLLTENREPSLEPALRYERARALESTDPRVALLEYERVASIDPLPQGRYTDEALLAAARLRRSQGDAVGALQTLSLLLEARDTSLLAGSYERAAYAEARWLQGRILRDELGRPGDAAATFELLVREHPTSRRLDDARLDQAIAFALANEPERACESLRSLRQERPASRFAECLGLYCASEAEPTVGCCAVTPPAGVGRPARCPGAPPTDDGPRDP